MTLYHVEEFEDEADSEIEKEILLLHAIYKRRYIRPHKLNPAPYMYTSNDLTLCHTTHISFGGLVQIIQDDPIFKNSSSLKKSDISIWLAIALSQLGSNSNGVSLGKTGMLLGASQGAIVG
ncbi:hypothetical protein O181_110283 [Austropuccinia psidii MF-1]|uniref:Uncharacterized protein n=1 Tax=Austropuccinia psidii MF-1 TaxID=1389203 RepID=A0A9Q3JXG7_9BASI|nr:hypothetical protein [Austropuccinia psidii MF-1]